MFCFDNMPTYYGDMNSEQVSPKISLLIPTLEVPDSNLGRGQDISSFPQSLSENSVTTFHDLYFCIHTDLSFTIILLSL
jgi:hypothetical protein